MGIDWMIVATVAGPILGAAVGGAIARAVERRPRLVAYYGHVSAFVLQTDGGPMDVFTHNLIVKNTGGRTAKRVRLGHDQLPNFNIFPRVEHEVVDVGGGAKEILFPAVVPGEQITVSYMYFPPVTYHQINRCVKSDEGMAKTFTVLLQRQYPRWFNVLVGVIFLIGLITLFYLLVQAVIAWLGAG